MSWRLIRDRGGEKKTTVILSSKKEKKKDKRCQDEEAVLEYDVVNFEVGSSSELFSKQLYSLVLSEFIQNLYWLNLL